jgi:release factor glutamine methyltransferase
VKKLKELRDNLLVSLSVLYPGNEAKSVIDILLSRTAGMSSRDIAIDPDLTVEEDVAKVILDKLDELLTFKPVQYVTGFTSFYGIDLVVNSSVLIPRPETEELVKWILDENHHKEGIKILDIGTGSGCIIIALGKNLKGASLSAYDISGSALETAKANAEMNKAKVDFHLVDILRETPEAGSKDIDIIVSNPPYVMESEKGLMNRNVLDFEPARALFVPDEDPLLFYRAIAGFARKCLKKEGILYLEINENSGDELRALLMDQGFTDVILRRDMQGKNRMISCRVKP